MPNEALMSELIRQSQLSVYGQAPPPSQVNPFNFPGVNPLLALLFPMLGRAIFGPNFIGMQFFPQQSLYSRLQAEAFDRAKSEAVRFGALADRGTQAAFLYGLADSLGIDRTPRLDSIINRLTRYLSYATPFLAEMAPDLLNTLHGARGSAAVMASRMMSAGRFMVDPVTGRFGLTGRSAGYLVANIADLMQGGGLRTLGMDAGRAGLLFEELQRRGLGISGGIASRPFQEQVRELSRITQTPVEDLIRLSEEDVTQYSALLRKADADRIKSRIKEMSGVVDALRDIFGDMGRPNAPMRELIAGLEMLTQNSLTSFSPDQMARIVRTTQMVLRHTGMTMGSFLALQTAGAQEADNLGLDRSLLPDIANSSALFGTAVIAQGRLDIPAFGSRSLDQLAIRDQQLRLRAAASPVVQQMAVLIRAAQAGLLNENSEAARYAYQLMRNPEAARNLTTEQWLQMMQEGGISRDVAMTMLHQTHFNQQPIRDFRLFDAGRVIQREADLVPRIQDAVFFTIDDVAKSLGLGDEEIAGISNELTRRILEAPPEIQRDQTRLRRFIIDYLTNEAEGLAGKIDETQARTISELLLGEIDTKARDLGYVSAQEMFTLHNPEILAERRKQEQQVAREAELAKSMAKLGRSGPLKRVISMFAEGDAESFREAMGIIFGGVKTEEVFRAALSTDADSVRALSSRKRAAAMTEAVAQLSKVFYDDEAELAQQQEAGDIIRAITEGGTLAQETLVAKLKSLGLSDADVARVLQGDEKILEDALSRQPGATKESIAAQKKVIAALRIAAIGGGLSVTAPDEVIIGSEEVDRRLIEVQRKAKERREKKKYEETVKSLKEELKTTEDSSRKEQLEKVISILDKTAKEGDIATEMKIGEEAYQHMRRILKTEGLDDEEIAAVIRGDRKAPEAVRREIDALRYKSREYVRSIVKDHPELIPERERRLEEGEGAEGGFGTTIADFMTEMHDMFMKLIEAVTGDKKVKMEGKLKIEGDEGKLEAEGTEYGSVEP